MSYTFVSYFLKEQLMGKQVYVALYIRTLPISKYELAWNQLKHGFVTWVGDFAVRDWNGAEDTWD